METVIIKQQNTQTMRQKLYDLLVAISWADLSRTYFGKSSSWLYHKLDGRDGNGKPTAFTPDPRARFSATKLQFYSQKLQPNRH